MKMFERMVIKQGVRPKVDDQWSDTIKDLFARAFVPHPKRPLMVEVCDILREELMGVTDEVIPDKFDVSFKSRGSNLSRGSNESGVLPPVLRASLHGVDQLGRFMVAAASRGPPGAALLAVLVALDAG